MWQALIENHHSLICGSKPVAQNAFYSQRKDFIVRMTTPGKPLGKYWRQRYDLFSDWEEGMMLDNEAWYSTTPTIIAEHQAIACCFGEKYSVDSCIVLDAFCGVGGNSIAFAKAGMKVIACDIDSEKVKMVG